MYPVTYQVENPGEGRNRLTVFFRPILAAPWFIWNYLYGFAAGLAAIGAWFSIVFTGRYPEGLYNFTSGYARYVGRYNGWTWLLDDPWPPFNGEPNDAYPIRVGTPEPLPAYDRLKTGLRFLIGIPVSLLAFVQYMILGVVGLIAYFAILFTGKFPEGLYDPARSAAAYLTRSSAYFMLITEDWPPFSLEEQSGAGGQLPSSTPGATLQREALPDRQAGN